MMSAATVTTPSAMVATNEPGAPVKPLKVVERDLQGVPTGPTFGEAEIVHLANLTTPPPGFRYSERLGYDIPEEYDSMSKDAREKNWLYCPSDTKQQHLNDCDDNTTESGSFVPGTEPDLEEGLNNMSSQDAADVATGNDDAWSDISSISGASRMSETELYQLRKAKWHAKTGITEWQDPDAWRYEGLDDEEDEEEPAEESQAAETEPTNVLETQEVVSVPAWMLCDESQEGGVPEEDSDDEGSHSSKKRRLLVPETPPASPKSEPSDSVVLVPESPL